MKLTDSTTYLSLIRETLESQIIPSLPSGAVRSNAEFIAAIVHELQRREHAYPDSLAPIIREGEAIAALMEQALDNTAATAFSPNNNSIDAFGELTKKLTELANALSHSSIDPEQREGLLIRAAEWELTAHNKLLSLGPTTTAGTSEGDPLPRAALETFIQSRHPDGDKVRVTSFDRVPGGYGKQTWAVDIEDAAARKRPLIVRKLGRVSLSTHKSFDLDREFHLLTAVNRTGFPAPRPLWLGTQVPGVDAAFYLMERLPGKPPGSLIGGSNQFEDRFVLEWAEVLARLHTITPESMRDYLQQYDGTNLLSETVEQTYRRYVADWHAYAEREQHLPSPALVYLFDWLQRNVPQDQNRPVMIHGDFGVHNMLAENGHVTGVVDWEMACFGSPVMDLAYVKPEVEKHMEWSRFVAHYVKCSGRDIDLSAIPYYDAYISMRGTLSLNMGTRLIQEGRIREPRFAMFELGITAYFMKMGLAGVAKAKGQR